MQAREAEEQLSIIERAAAKLRAGINSVVKTCDCPPRKPCDDMNCPFRQDVIDER